MPLLKFGEEDYEALENDQLTVQGMMASRYVAQFEKEVSMWSVSLLNVADVFTCARGVPRRCLHSNTTRVHRTMSWLSRTRCERHAPRRTINEIQRTWSYLEPLFIHSDEVKRELPVDAERFAGIDVEIKDILTTSVTQREK